MENASNVKSISVADFPIPQSEFRPPHFPDAGHQPLTHENPATPDFRPSQHGINRQDLALAFLPGVGDTVSFPPIARRASSRAAPVSLNLQFSTLN
jgi:hypothetical protein